MWTDNAPPGCRAVCLSAVCLPQNKCSDVGCHMRLALRENCRSVLVLSVGLLTLAIAPLSVRFAECGRCLLLLMLFLLLLWFLLKLHNNLSLPCFCLFLCSHRGKKAITSANSCVVLSCVRCFFLCLRNLFCPCCVPVLSPLLGVVLLCWAFNSPNLQWSMLWGDCGGAFTCCGEPFPLPLT